MRLEQWSHLRHAVKCARDMVARDLDKMEASGKSYEQITENYPRYSQAVKLFVDFEEIIEHMDFSISVREIETFQYGD